MKALLLLCTVWLATFGVVACAGNEVERQSRSDSFTVSGPARLEIRLQSGRVNVSGGGAGSVRIDTVLRDPDKVSFSARQQGDTIVVESNVEGTSFTDVVGFRTSRGADLTITSPPDTVVDIETLTGRIELTGLDGGGTASTGNGGVQLRDLRGDYQVRSGGGDIEVEGFEGSLRAETDDGLLAINEANGSFQAKTSYGRLIFDGSLQRGGESHFESADGRVLIQVRQATSLALDASGSSVELTAPPSFQASTSSNSRVQGSIGAGDTRLRARAGNGSLSITLVE